ncbi:MAG TPA: dUTP diphosphatase [Candidatus Doudnabacteria bacterium]|nr:dUTP diphosphatase [Candidatus Doudnabacteria bacterium]
MLIKVKKTSPEAILPSYSHPGDSGLDLFSNEDKDILSGETCLVNTGISIELPNETEAQIRPRSGLALKNGITVLNTPGTIDAGYRGEIGVILINHSKNTFHISKKMKIAQMVITPVITVGVIEVLSLNETSRGSGGFGSTDNNGK